MQVEKMGEISKETKALIREAKVWAKKNRGGIPEIAKALGVERQTVANWISGHRTPTREHSIAIRKFLDQKGGK